MGSARRPPAPVVDALSQEDLEEVAAIEAICFPTPWSIASFRYELLENPYASLFGARLPGAGLVGFACVWVIDQELKINNLAVHPRWRGRGVARGLLEHVLGFAIRQGCLEATLEVRPSNAPALRLYERAGFEVVGRRRGYYSDTHEDALVMVRRLAPGAGG